GHTGRSPSASAGGAESVVPQHAQKVSAGKNRYRPGLARPGFQTDAQERTELALFGQGQERLEIVGGYVLLRLYLDRRMVADHKINLEARGRPPVGQRLPRDIVAMGDEFVKDDGLQ